MTENYIVSLVAWIILYASFWLTKHNPVSTAFRRRECHTGFLAKWLEKTIFPFRWYGSRPTYEYAIGLLLLCCILFTVSLHISVAHFDLPQIYFDTVYEHCRFTFISGICAVCGYYCLIVDVSRIEKVLYIIAALFFWGFALVSFLFPFFYCDTKEDEGNKDFDIYYQGKLVLHDYNHCKLLSTNVIVPILKVETNISVMGSTSSTTKTEGS